MRMKKLLSLVAAASVLFVMCKSEDKVESVPVKGITINEDSIELVEGESTTLTATVTPENATDKTVSWSSSKPEIASVDDDGLVTAFSAGDAVITASAGGKKATCSVSVVRAPFKQLPYSEDFEDISKLDEWTFVDADRDGYGWWHNTFTEGTTVDIAGHNLLAAHSGLGSMCSASYITQTTERPEKVLNPNNWMFTPAVKLSSKSNYLSFWVAPQNPDWASDKYSVYISTETSASADNCTLLLTETLYTLDEKDSFLNHVIQIPEQFNGQVVYIAFRHYESRDNFIMKIDDVSITEDEPGAPNQ